MRRETHTSSVPSFDEFLNQFLEEPPEVMGTLADIVTRGRMQADDLTSESLETLAKFDLVAFLVTRAPGRPVRTWVYPSPLGLRLFAVLERETEREEQRARPVKVSARRRRGSKSGVSR